jgi:uncharacterized protein involved in response to NO
VAATAERMRGYSGPALFSFGFRPFFLFAAIWAALAAPIWTVSYLGFAPAQFATRAWHAHEMLFGYLAAVVAGFLLTAVPNWTGRLPIMGVPLAALFALWLVGRLAMLAADQIGPWAGLIDALFLAALALVVWREVLAGRNVRNLPVCILVALLAAANIAHHLRVPAPDAVWLGERLALAAAALLIALIGGRIVPSFTRNWMAKRNMTPPPAPADRFDLFVLLLTAAALVAWLAAPLSPFAGALLNAAGVGALARLARWRGWRTFAEPLVFILHLGYLWLAAAFVLLGISAFTPAAAPPSAGVHALAAGAIGVMTLAVMTRATRGHSGRELTAPWGTQLIYLLVNLGALARVAAALAPAAYAPLLLISAGLWSAAFALFAVVYGPMLARPRLAASVR